LACGRLSVRPSDWGTGQMTGEKVPMLGIRRREFITLLGGAAAAWPLAARGQQPAIPVIGFLNSVSPGQFGHFLDMFRRGLNETGFVTAGDPVKEGFVASFSRPGGNATGINLLLSAMEGKRLGLLRELLPSATLIGVLLNPAMPTFADQLNEIQEAARALAQQIQVLHVSNEREIDAAFASASQLRAAALLVTADPFMFSRLHQLVALATRYSIPVFYFAREFAAAGGLISYGISLAEAYRMVGVYTGRILKGEKPADLPVQQLTKFEMVINLKTAKALGLEVPPGLSARADEVIE
jgi:putative ABC transport system substrate-binding protein